MAFDFPSSPSVGQQYSPVAGTTYTYNGVGWTLAQGAGTYGAPLAIRTFTATGPYVPTFGTAVAVVECVGGGGAGASATGGSGLNVHMAGGGAGGYSRKLLTAAQIGASQTITVGAGGAGATGASGGDGSATSFGALCIANGGLGAINTTHAAGAGGSITGAVGDVVAAGEPGGAGGSDGNADGSSAASGHGGSGPWGGGGTPAWVGGNASQPGDAGKNYGSGGSGAQSNNYGAAMAPGGSGSPGVCIVTEYGPLSAVATMVKIVPITGNTSYVPSPGLVSAIVETVAGGGGGGGTIGSAGTQYCAGGGGSGGYSRRALTAAQIGASQTVTIGAAGVGGAAGNNVGSAGGDTSFGSLCIAKGGGGAPSPGSGVAVGGGAGGATTGAVGDVVAAGAPGGGSFVDGNYGTAATYGGSGLGGSSFFGGGGTVQSGVSGGTTPSGPAGNYGGGGAGGHAFNNAGGAAGGNGSAGVCIVTEFIAVSAAIVAPVPGSLVQIERKVISSPVATVDFITGINATYDEYEIHFYGLESAANGNLAMQISQDGGATWKAGATDYTWQNVFIPNPGSSASFNASSSPAMILGGHDASTVNRAAGTIKFYLPAATVHRKPFMFEMFHVATVFASTRGSAMYTVDQNAINGVRFYNGSGNLNNGTFVLYGRAK